MSERAPDEGARTLLREMVATPSPSGAEDRCANRLAEFFSERGREVYIDEVGNVRAPGADDVLLTSHLDTVPGEIPVETEETDTGTILRGRGSVDAKGPLVAMAVAAARTGVSFAGVVGEEVDSRGARYLVDDRAEPAAVVNGEPSGWDGITLGYRGLVAGTYVCASESGHTSRPENNAIEDAFDWWHRVETAFADDEWAPVTERVTTKPVSVDAGVSADGLSVEATMDVQLRVPLDMTADEVREVADGELQTGTIHWTDMVEPVLTSPRTKVARLFRGAIRRTGGDPRLLRKTGTSDMNVYNAHWDCQMVTYGPGDSAFDHAPDEHIHLDEFDRAVRVLEDVSDRIQE